MGGKYTSFEDIVISLSHVLGANNLHNELPLIKRYIIDAEKEINPYRSLLVKKRMTYHVGNGNFDGKNIVLPKDFNKLDTVGCCKDGLCPGQYIETPTFIVLCDGKKRDKITFTYYGMACDGTGNPFIVSNHKEAVVSYIEWMYYKPKMNKGQGNMNYFNMLKREWEDRCMEARGEDVMEELFDNLDEVMSYQQMSIREIVKQEMYSRLDSCECQTCFVVDYDDNQYMDKKVKFWQFNRTADNTTVQECSSDLFLADKLEIDMSMFLNGHIVNYTSIGKYGFCIEDVEENSVEIFDMLNNSLKNSVESYYDFSNRRLVFLSKTLISHSSIYFKFKYNG